MLFLEMRGPDERASGLVGKVAIIINRNSYRG